MLSALEKSATCLRFVTFHVKLVQLEIARGFLGLPRWGNDREPACQCRRHKRDAGSIPGWEDPLEKGMATHSSILAWRIPWTEEPGGLESMGSQSWM